MADPAGFPLHQARFADATKIPMTPFGVEMLVMMYLIALLAYVTYGLRMYSKITSKQTGIEDWFMTAATIFSIALMVASYWYLKYGYVGVPQSQLSTTRDDAAARFASWLIQLLYSPIVGLVRSSTLFFMLKITGHIKNIRWTIHVINIINMCLTVATFLGSAVGCMPVSAYWYQDEKKQYKIHFGNFILATICLSIVADFFVLGIPFWAFMKTQLPLGTRVGVVAIFMAGGLATAMGIVRFCTLVDYYVDPSPDYGFGQTWGPAYAQLETSIAIITACLPVMYPLLRRWFPRVFGGPGSGKRSGAEEGQRAGYAAGGSGAGEGASVRMRDFGQRRSSVRLWSDSNAESNEELFKPAGIVKTTHIQVSYSNAEAQDSAGINRKNTPRAPDPTLGF